MAFLIGAGLVGPAAAGEWVNVSVGSTNDWWAGQDANWTNSFQIDATYEPEGGGVQKMAKRLSGQSYAKASPVVTVGLVHDIFTPWALSEETQPMDRAYAGRIALRLGTSVTSDEKKSQTIFELGAIGPGAAGDRVQNAWHDIVGVERFQGWKHQIPRRTVWSVEHEEIWSGWQSDSGQMQIQPLAGMVVGNWRRGIWAGGEVQWYSQNAEIWKNARASRRGGMVFGRMDVRRVFYDGSLEPGLDGAAQDITLRNTIAQVTAGVRWSAYQWDVEWARTWSQKSLTNR